MKLFNNATTVGCMVLVCSVLAPNVRADEWNRKTVMTFSGPVEIPGVHLTGWGVLPAGTYVFKILDSLSDRHIVQIFNKEETSIYATILAIPNYRLKATDKTVVTFSERPVGQPEALRAWFYPGRNWGEEFVYPKSRAMEIAKATNTPVLFTSADIPMEVSESIKSSDAPVVVELKRAPIMAIKPNGEEVQVAEVVTAPPVQAELASTDAATPSSARTEVAAQAPVTTAAVDTLPATASSMPLIALVGLLALGAAMALRSAEKDSQ